MNLKSKFTFLFWFIFSLLIALLGLLAFAVYKGTQFVNTFLT